MRLLRLTTENTNAIFDNSFNSDILLEKDTQIGLQNINFTLETKFIKIANSNNTITFSLDSGDNVKTTRLLYESYTENNIQTLLNDITLKLNGQLEGDTIQELGKMWKVRLINEKISTRVRTSNFNFKRLDWTIPYYSNVSLSGNDTTLTHQVIIRNSVANTESNLNLLYNETQPLTRGCGSMRVSINKFLDNGTGAEDNGFTFGVAKTPPSEWGITGIPDSAIKYAIKIHKHSDFYSVYKDGLGWVSTNKGYLSGGGSDAIQGQQDEVEIQISEGQLFVALATYNPTITDYEDFTLLGTGAEGGGSANDILVDDTDLFPFIVVRGLSPNFSLRGFEITLNPYSLSINNTLPPVNLNSFTSALYSDVRTNKFRKLAMKPLTIPIPPEFMEISYSGELADFLGYSRYTQPMPLLSSFEVHNFEAVGEDTFYLNKTGLYILELLDIDLESYDALTHNRRNMIATLPVKVENGIVVYEPSNVNFINIKNADKRVLRNIKARLLMSSLDQIKIVGLATATLLLRDSADRGF